MYFHVFIKSVKFDESKKCPQFVVNAYEKVFSS